ncbi:MAG: hypothetical protein JWM16_3352 [Verrucomicrobiales bacterium]|nr:hypothetical protein [Verrucomicrobiales bacterium]
MKIRSLAICLMPVLVAVVGCDTRQVHSAKAYGMVDRAPQTAEKGYVEFYTHDAKAPVPIFRLDSKERPHVVGAVGLHEGDRYSKVRYEADVTTKLRVALPPGNTTFMFEREGQRVRVPVVAGQVTPVEIFYTRLQKGDLLDFYMIDTEVLPSQAATDDSTPASKKK